MAGRARAISWENLSRLRRMRRFQNAATIFLVVLGPILALATFLVLGPLDRSASALSLRLVLLADLVYVLFVVALVLARIASMVAASGGSARLTPSTRAPITASIGVTCISFSLPGTR